MISNIINLQAWEPKTPQSVLAKHLTKLASNQDRYEQSANLDRLQTHRGQLPSKPLLKWFQHLGTHFEDLRAEAHAQTLVYFPSSDTLFQDGQTWMDKGQTATHRPQLVLNALTKLAPKLLPNTYALNLFKAVTRDHISKYSLAATPEIMIAFM